MFCKKKLQMSKLQRAKGPAPKFCVYFSFIFSKLPPLCSPSPLGEAKGGRSGGQKLLSPFGPTNDFILWRWQLFRICLQIVFSIYQPSFNWKGCLQVTPARFKIDATAMLVQTLFRYDIQMSNHV